MASSINISEIIEFFRALPASSPPLPQQLPRLSVLTAVSGGADSVALTHLLSEYREELGIEKLAIAHVNHGLRGKESDDDEAFVRMIAESLRLEFHCTKIDHFHMEDAGIEERARRHRYQFFAEIAKKHRFNYIATAHTANDQAETVLMRLIRGTGVRGLRGIHPVRADGVIRPLLNVNRRQLEDWLYSKGLTYRTDSSNADDRFRRNLIRNKIMPLLTEANPAAVQNIAACASSAARAWGVMAGNVDKWTDQHVPWRSDCAFHIEKAGLADNVAAPEALIALFDEYGISPSRLHVARVMAAADLSSGEHLLPDGWKFYPREDRVCFVKIGALRPEITDI